MGDRGSGCDVTLSSVSKNVPCPQEGCKKILRHNGSLRLHLAKRHKIGTETELALFNKRTLTDVQGSAAVPYFCPEKLCRRSYGYGKPFLTRSKLKQHYLHCHAKRTLHCNDCGKSFSFEAALLRHKNLCGQTFTCACGAHYETPDGLRTHLRREQLAGNATHQLLVPLQSQGSGLSWPVCLDSLRQDPASTHTQTQTTEVGWLETPGALTSYDTTTQTLPGVMGGQFWGDSLSARLLVDVNTQTVGHDTVPQELSSASPLGGLRNACCWSSSCDPAIPLCNQSGEVISANGGPVMHLDHPSVSSYPASCSTHTEPIEDTCFLLNDVATQTWLDFWFEASELSNSHTQTLDVSSLFGCEQVSAGTQTFDPVHSHDPANS